MLRTKFVYGEDPYVPPVKPGQVWLRGGIYYLIVEGTINSHSSRNLQGLELYNDSSGSLSGNMLALSSLDIKSITQSGKLVSNMCEISFDNGTVSLKHNQA